MRHVPKGLAAAILCTLLGGLGGGPATAAASGVGTTSARTTVVAVDLGTGGSLLAVRLLDDEAGSTIDSGKGGPLAHGRMTGVNVTSEAAPAVSITPAPAKTRQPGGEKKATRGSVDLTQPYDGVTVDSSVLAGTLGVVDLSSDAGDSRAASSVSGVLTSATVAGDLARVDGATSTLDAEAATSGSQTTRTVSVDEVVVLDLGSLLDGLDLSLLDLPVSTLVGLLDALDQEVPGIGDAAAVNDAIDTLQAEITELSSQPTLPTGTTVSDAVDAVNGLGLGELIDPGTEAAIEVIDPVAQVNALVDELQAELADVLTGGVQALDDSPLLVAKGAQASVTTKAVDTVEGSVAEASGGIGSIEVGGAVIDGVELVDGVQAVADTVTNVNKALKAAMGGIDPGLADTVAVSLFDRAGNRGVSTVDGYVQAADGVTVLTATVTPPSTLPAIVQAIKDQTGVGEAIAANDGTAPQVSDAMTELEATLGGGAVQGAAGGVSVRVAEILGTSDFRPAAAPNGDSGPGGGENGPGGGENGGDPADSSTTGGGGDHGRPELPRTGSNSWPMTALAVLLVALGLGLREWPQLAAVTSRRR